MLLSLFCFFAVPVVQEIYLLTQFSKILGCRLRQYYAQLNRLQNIWRRFLKFCPENFLQPPPKSTKNFEKKFILEEFKKFWVQKFKFLLPPFLSQLSFVYNAANCIPISYKTVGDRFSVNLYFSANTSNFANF